MELLRVHLLSFSWLAYGLDLKNSSVESLLSWHGRKTAHVIDRYEQFFSHGEEAHYDVEKKAHYLADKKQKRAIVRHLVAELNA
ncbi:hypothetical protein KP509_13G004400 [Ceratopteris richardii]|uniref:Uncharacterized protein n=1 Tax=Ceratopteris richardii TaxID=49495 RepID=A0A8T2TI80_CERRI|nr:hypothetical protein KP509_13G004400 [Ceratopteris richardii]